MSWNYSYTAKDKETAKAELCRRNDEEGGHMPEDAKAAVHAMIDALPEPLFGFTMINVATFGHFDTDGHTTSNMTAAVQHVADL
jgi:nucleoid DNA-binding protein